MRRQFTSNAIRLGIASVIAACSVSAFAQQGQGGGELPPPTLDTPAPPQTQPAPAPTTAPPPTAAPASSAAPAPTAAPAPSASPAPAPAASSDQPWYRRAWNSVTGWFSGEERGDAPAPAPAPAARPQAEAPAAPARGSTGPVQGYAVDSPERTIRTGVLGECVKTGTWREGMQVEECGGPAPEPEAMATAEPAPAPMPEPMPEPQPEPVQVQPLPTPMDEPQAPLAAEPEPEPAPIPPPPAPRETMTLSADALFAVNSDVLKPASKDSLAGLAGKLADMEYESVNVVGHTDPTGSAALNDRLSRRRAEAVKRHLIELGVPAEKISAQGVGSSIPVVDPQTCMSLPKGQRAACFQPDRRVDIEVTGTVAGMANP